MRILDKPGLTFDDVLLLPRKGYTNSRLSDVKISISTQLTPRTMMLSTPIISANMDTVTRATMALEMARLGGLGIIDRFLSIEEHAQELQCLGRTPVVVCIGVTESERERLVSLRKSVEPKAVLIDTAHGHSKMMIDQIHWLKECHGDLDIIAGNVCTADAALALIRAGAHCVKVGVGPGSMCTTRIHTGCGVPQLTAIMDVREGIEKVHSQQRGNPWRPTVIADGGIRNSGDIVKALAAGADAVMIGRLFAGTDETPSYSIISGKRKYRGMASRDFQEEWKGIVHSVEGESMMVSERGPVEAIFSQLREGILSGMSYQGAENLNDLYEYAEFITMTPAGYIESTPHGLN